MMTSCVAQQLVASVVGVDLLDVARGRRRLRPAAFGGAAPKPPKITFQIERFIARHMMYDRIAPRAADERAGDDQEIVARA